MSIVGTRPPLISETNLYELHHRVRLAIKPGITGMWQVSGRSDITDFEEVVDFRFIGYPHAVKQYLTDYMGLIFEKMCQDYLVIGVLTQSELYEKTISNMLECKSRGAYLMGLTTYGKYEIEDQVNFTVTESLVAMIKTPNNTFPVYWCECKENSHAPFVRKGNIKVIGSEKKCENQQNF